MTKQELIDFCLTFPAAYEDYPFDDLTASINPWTVMRHRTNKKSFAFIHERNDCLCINLKCDPFEADFLRQMFAAVSPGYHMNKTHWNTVTLGGDNADGNRCDVSEDEVKRMIANSYNLIKPKARTRK